MEKEALLTFEELERLAMIFSGLGVRRIRLTGGEPLVRQGLDKLVSSLARISSLDDLSLTTNGSLLAAYARGLKTAGLMRINVSLDTLRSDRFLAVTQRNDLPAVIEGLKIAKEVGLAPIKINSVVIKGFNEDEILELVEFGRVNGFEMRFIEFLDVGNANSWTLKRTVQKKQILETINSRYPIEEVHRGDVNSPSVDYRYLDGLGRVGIIGSLTEPFCSDCTRARLTADGHLVTCLFSENGIDLKLGLRAGMTDEELSEQICSVWLGRVDRYSVKRWEAIKSGNYKSGKKIEMITLGG